MHPQQPPTGPRPQPRKSNASLKVALVGCGGIVAVLGGVTVLGLVLQATGVVKPPPTREAFPPLSPAPATAAAKPLAKAVRPPVAENLVFSGQVKGTLTHGLNPRGISNKDPNPPPGFGPFNATQCTFSDTNWEADVLGDVGGTRVSLRLTIDNPLPAAGTKDLVNRANFGPMIALFGANGKYNKDTFQITGTNLDLVYPVVGSASLTVNPDKRAGSMKIELTDSPGGTKVLETIHGSWRCA